MGKPVDPVIEALWRFVRGDLSSLDFETWPGAVPPMDERLGAELFLAAIDVDYGSPYEVLGLKDRLREYLRANGSFPCCCIELPDSGVVDMGDDAIKTFSTFTTQKDRGEPYWWLRVERCTSCREWWLIGQEEHHNDLFCLRRITPETGAGIVEHDRWPADFDRYETLLQMEDRAGRSVEYVDPLGSWELLRTVEIVVNERPEVTVPELSRLLHIDLPVARALAERVRDAAARGTDLYPKPRS